MDGLERAVRTPAMRTAWHRREPGVAAGRAVGVAAGVAGPRGLVAGVTAVMGRGGGGARLGGPNRAMRVRRRRAGRSPDCECLAPLGGDVLVVDVLFSGHGAVDGCLVPC